MIESLHDSVSLFLHLWKGQVYLFLQLCALRSVGKAYRNVTGNSSSLYVKTTSIQNKNRRLMKCVGKVNARRAKLICGKRVLKMYI